MILEGSIVNQIEIRGFADNKEAVKFRKKIKSLKSVFDLSNIDKSLDFTADECSWKMKDDFSLVYLFLTEDSFPEEMICSMAGKLETYHIQYMVIAPSGEGVIYHYSYSNGKLILKKEVKGNMAIMMGDLIKGGFQ